MIAECAENIIKNISDTTTINESVFKILSKNKYGRRAGQCNWQRIPDCWSSIKDTELLNISSTKMGSILRT